MTDRIKGLTVSLTHDMHEDSCKRIIKAILMIKGVDSVIARPIKFDSYLEKQRFKDEIADKIKKIWEEL